MPNNDCTDFSPEHFAELMALFDTDNPSETEAMDAGRLMRRLLVATKLRLVDVIGRKDVMQALDAQLQPVREEGRELKAAFLRIENLEGLTKVQEGIIRELQKKPGGGPFNEGLVTAVSLGVVLLLVAAAFR
jgi:hypothetical protein